MAIGVFRSWAPNVATLDVTGVSVKKTCLSKIGSRATRESPPGATLDHQAIQETTQNKASR